MPSVPFPSEKRRTCCVYMCKHSFHSLILRLWIICICFQRVWGRTTWISSTFLFHPTNCHIEYKQSRKSFFLRSFRPFYLSHSSHPHSTLRESSTTSSSFLFWCSLLHSLSLEKIAVEHSKSSLSVPPDLVISVYSHKKKHGEQHPTSKARAQASEREEWRILEIFFAIFFLSPRHKINIKTSRS